MVPVIELRGAVPIGIGWGYPFWLVYLVCVVGNLLPVPVLIPFAGRVLRWGAGLPRVGGLFRKILSIGEKKVAQATGTRRAILLALYLFVAVPAPGTGAWSGALIATLLGMPVRRAFWPIAAGVATAGLIMGVASYGVLGLLG
ncbi:MAG: small multidrug export protein [Oscillospiraceae bacterium]|nr:MAG: small multidrug export protein [Oscillospiraceae bacterium]